MTTSGKLCMFLGTGAVHGEGGGGVASVCFMPCYLLLMCLVGAFFQKNECSVTSAAADVGFADGTQKLCQKFPCLTSFLSGTPASHMPLIMAGYPVHAGWDIAFRKMSLSPRRCACERGM